MSRRAKASGGGGAPAWMATFADMMSLLLTFFVLLLSFATMDIVKFQDAMGSISEALGATTGGTGILEQSSSPALFDNTMAASSPPTQSNKEVITDELEDLVSEFKLDKDVEVESSERGVILRVSGSMFFTPGTAELKYEAQPVLEKVASLMRQYPGRVSIEGHTDNIPISAEARYASNWELSTARAYSALRFLNENESIDATQLNIAGFGDIRPVAPNDSPEGRAKNRRVEFVFVQQ